MRDIVLLPLAGRSGLLSSIYYAGFSGAFRHEHRAAVEGRRRYEAQDHRIAQHDYLLRRNIHMLEKGLSMQPRRSTFALDYIRPTVACYLAMAELSPQAPEEVDVEQLHWAHDVLEAYFEVAGPHPTVQLAQVAFATAPELTRDASDARVPYARDLREGPPVHYPDLLNLAVRRRSVRWYLPRPVERDKIDQALQIAALAPSACNRQPFEFRIFDDPSLLAKVVAVPPGTRGFAHNIPAFAVLVGQMRAFFSERDRHLIYIDGSLAAMSFVLALESLGLASCCINWAENSGQDQRMASALHLGRDERVIMCIAFGYPDPDGLVPYSAKRPLARFRRFNID